MRCKPSKNTECCARVQFLRIQIERSACTTMELTASWHHKPTLGQAAGASTASQTLQRRQGCDTLQRAASNNTGPPDSAVQDGSSERRTLRPGRGMEEVLFVPSSVGTQCFVHHASADKGPFYVCAENARGRCSRRMHVGPGRPKALFPLAANLTSDVDKMRAALGGISPPHAHHRGSRAPRWLSCNCPASLSGLLLPLLLPSRTTRKTMTWHRHAS